MAKWEHFKNSKMTKMEIFILNNTSCVYARRKRKSTSQHRKSVMAFIGEKIILVSIFASSSVDIDQGGASWVITK